MISHRKKLMSYLSFFATLISCLVLQSFCFAQVGLRGKITTKQNTPLPFASISVNQSTIGTIANNEGDYELSLSPGHYEVNFQFLGYATIRKKVVITDQWQTVNVSLEEQIINLESAHIGTLSEDPAYSVMRRAIAKARFHEMQIMQYKAQAYTRTTGTFTSIPLLAKSRLKKEGILENQAFLNESVTEVQYERPNKYQQRVVSTRNSLDNTIPTPNQYVLASFYSPSIQGTISPLSPKALSAYKFEYEGFFEDQGFVINKIKVIPKLYGQGVVKGTLYIVEDSWAIHSFDFQTVSHGFTVGLKQTSSYVQNVWIPLSQNFQLKGKFMGFAGHMRYVVSLKYNELQVDPALKESIVLHDHQKEELPTRKSKEALQDRIQKQEEFSTKDFRKLVDQFEKEDKKTRRAKGENLRIVRVDSMTVDSLAHTRDSTYWQTLRPIPLSTSELRSYSKLDSIQVIKDSLRIAKNQANDSARFHLTQLLVGGRYQLKNKQRLIYKGPLPAIQYNTVDGVVLDASLEWQKTPTQQTQFGSKVTGRYALQRQQLNGKLQAYYKHKYSFFQLEGGQYTYQLNELNPVNPLINTIATLFFEQNDLKLFDKRFIRASYKQELLDQAISITTSFEHSQRQELQNLANPWRVIHWSNRSFTPNTPYIQELATTQPFINSNASIASVALHIRPWRKFIVQNGRKFALPNRSPELSVVYKKSFDTGKHTQSYDFIEVYARTQWRMNPRSTMKVGLNAGKFFTDHQLSLVDYKHFMSNNFFIQLPSSSESYRRLPLYQYSTQNHYFQSHITWTSRRFLLGRLPVIRMLGLQESLQHHYLKTPSSPHYQEFIYGVEGLLRVLKCEFILQYNNLTYNRSGFRIGTTINIGK